MKRDYRREAQDGMSRATSAAAKKDPLFADKIRASVPRLLIKSQDHRMKGEELTTALFAMGIKVKKQAMGPVLSSMEKTLGLIRQDGTYPRVGGHGAKDGKIWKLTDLGVAACK